MRKQFWNGRVKVQNKNPLLQKNNRNTGKNDQQQLFQNSGDQVKAWKKLKSVYSRKMVNHVRNSKHCSIFTCPIVLSHSPSPGGAWKTNSVAFGQTSTPAATKGRRKGLKPPKSSTPRKLSQLDLSQRLSLFDLTQSRLCTNSLSLGGFVKNY